MMGPNDGLITPPPKLRKQWIDESPDISVLDGHTRIGTDWGAVMDKAARWGFEQGVEACCEWLNGQRWEALAIHLRAARRPKPLSFKEQALLVLDDCAAKLDAAHENILRRALEAIDD